MFTVHNITILVKLTWNAYVLINSKKPNNQAAICPKSGIENRNIPQLFLILTHFNLLNKIFSTYSISIKTQSYFEHDIIISSNLGNANNPNNDWSYQRKQQLSIKVQSLFKDQLQDLFQMVKVSCSHRIEIKQF